MRQKIQIYLKKKKKIKFMIKIPTPNKPYFVYLFIYYLLNYLIIRVMTNLLTYYSIN